jgi:calcineurin-like phosphoesterase family protein
MIFVISDLHFDDADVLSEYNRPFDSVDDMNNELISRWNEVIGSEDTVYHVGDLTVKESESAALYRLAQLSGNIELLDGNHRPIQRSAFERSKLPIQRSTTIEYSGYNFFLTHKPAWVPDEWDSWAITVHHHDVSGSHPFVDPKSQRVNVAAEMIEFRPLAIDLLVDIIKRGERYQTISDVQ